MINVKIGKKNGVYRAISEGHAEFNPGNDKVCAAASVLMFTLGNSIENMTNTGKKRIKFDDKSGKADIRYQTGNPEDDAVAAVIFNTVMIGLMSMEQEYGAYITVQDV